MARNAVRLVKTEARKLKVTAVVPAYNEAKNIATVIRELTQTKLSHNKMDFVIVDDGSKDDTRKRAIESGANVVSLPYNTGIGTTVQTGFMYAVQNNADYVVQVDGDGQHIPSEIDKLIEVSEKENADVVIGTRFLNGMKKGLHTTTFLRWFAGRLLAYTVYFLSGQFFSDPTSGFRLYNKEAAKFIVENYPDDYPEVEILVLLVRNGFQVTETPVRMRSRAHGKSSISGWRPIYYVLKVIFASLIHRLRL